MTINELVLTTLTPVLANTWAVELPANPTFPAIVFEVDTQTEQQWVMGAGYDQHTISIYILAKSKVSLKALFDDVREAMLAVNGYLFEADSGDADYEQDASIYAYYSNHVVRLPRY
jgi:hypothetical protein